MVHPMIAVVNDDSSVSYAVANVLDAMQVQRSNHVTCETAKRKGKLTETRYISAGW